MIRTEREYRETVGRLDAERARLDEHRALLEAEGLEADAIARALDPIRSFQLQLEEEVEAYERLTRGEIDELINLRGLGHTLVALRIAKGLTQAELARRLGVHESQVSRDERNEYHGASIERASRVLDALNVDLRSGFDGTVAQNSSSEPPSPRRTGSP